MPDDIPREKIQELRARLEKEREQHQANVNAAVGALQAIDMLLAIGTEPAPE